MTEEQSNGEKNGENGNPKLSLGEIAAIDNEIAKAKTDQLQLLHNVSMSTVVLTLNYIP